MSGLVGLAMVGLGSCLIVLVVVQTVVVGLLGRVVLGEHTVALEAADRFGDVAVVEHCTVAVAANSSV